MNLISFHNRECRNDLHSRRNCHLSQRLRVRVSVINQFLHVHPHLRQWHTSASINTRISWTATTYQYVCIYVYIYIENGLSSKPGACQYVAESTFAGGYMQAYVGAKYPGLGAPKEQVRTVTPDALSILCHRVVKRPKARVYEL